MVKTRRRKLSNLDTAKQDNDSDGIGNQGRVPSNN